jgi:hypothetical protein
MDRSLIFLLLTAVLTVSARAELQLTPSVIEGEGDGITFKELAFSDGESKITYLPPRGWDYSGSAAQLTLRPPGKAQAEAVITRVPLSEPGKFDDESLKKLIDQTIGMIPQGSENVTIVSQERNPVVIDRKETFLLVLSYRLFGQMYNRSILFLNRGNEQLRFQLVARETDFKELQSAFFHSLFSWENL